MAPIFILWFGYGLAPKIGLILVIAFFPVTLSMLAGMQSVDRSLLSLMNSVGASRTQILFRIRVPHSLPNLMAGTKIAATLSVIGAIVGEFAGASDGLGYVIQFASTQLDTALVFAALLLVSVLASPSITRPRSSNASWCLGHRNSATPRVPGGQRQGRIEQC